MNRNPIFLLIAIALAACASADERQILREIDASVSKVQGIDVATEPQRSIQSYEAAISAMNRYLENYPGGSNATEVRSRRDKFSSELQQIRNEYSQYQNRLDGEPVYLPSILPSQCQDAAKKWADYLDVFPSARFSSLARQNKSKWEHRLQEEINRGFMIIIESAEIDSVKGSAHGIMSGRSWDPDIFEAASAPDPYAFLVIDGEVKAYTNVDKDTFKAEWNEKSGTLKVSDEQQVSIVVRDRDVAEKAAILLMGKGLLTFEGLEAANAALKRDSDDTICRWSGTIRELIERNGKNIAATGECPMLRAKVLRAK